MSLQCLLTPTAASLAKVSNFSVPHNPTERTLPIHHGPARRRQHRFGKSAQTGMVASMVSPLRLPIRPNMGVVRFHAELVFAVLVVAPMG